MIQLQVISGKKAGNDIVVRHFPFVIGRGIDAQLQLDDAGVWDRHVALSVDRQDGFLVAAQPSATLLVNGERVETHNLRNGDVLELGSVRLRFWLARTDQRTMRVREFLTWTALIAIFGAQIWLIYAVLR